jgi:hypothetical protein
MKVSFLSWIPREPDQLSEWFTVFRTLCQANKRDKECEILIVIPIAQTGEKSSSLGRNEIQEKIYEIVRNVRDQGKDREEKENSATNPKQETFLDAFFCDPKNVRTFGVPESENILSLINFLGYKARGTYLKFFHSKESISYLTARDIRIVFERNPSKLGSVAHFWEGNPDDETNFCSFVLTKNVFLGTGGFHLHQVSGFSDDKNWSDLLKIGVASVQLCHLYDCFLESAVKKDRKSRKNVFLVKRSCPHQHFRAFQGIVLTDRIPIPVSGKDREQQQQHHPSQKRGKREEQKISLLSQLLQTSLISIDSKTIIPQLFRQTSELKTQIDEFYQSIPETKMDIPENAKELPAAQSSIVSVGSTCQLPFKSPISSVSSSSSGSKGSNIVGFSWWNKRQEERKQEQEQKIALQRLEHLRHAISQRSTDTTTDDTLNGWEIWTIIFGIILILLMVVSITLSIIALSKTSTLHQQQQRVTT